MAMLRIMHAHKGGAMPLLMRDSSWRRDNELLRGNGVIVAQSSLRTGSQHSKRIGEALASCSRNSHFRYILWLLAYFTHVPSLTGGLTAHSVQTAASTASKAESFILP